MSVIDLFFDFIQEYHPQIMHQDWLVDSQLVNSKDITVPGIGEIIPLDMLEVKLILFYYEGNSEDVVFLLQDKKGSINILIGLIRNNELVNSVKLLF